jgi:selenocysteine lyase/cysteine desulfurase
MGMERRTFLSRSLLAVGGISLVPPAVRGLVLLPAPGRQEDWIEAIREQIPVTTRSVYFQTGGIAPSPQAVMDEVKAKLDFQNQGPADPRYSSEMSEIEPRLRAHLAKAFGAHPEEVALTHSTSEGINIVTWGVDWQTDDEVIVSNQEHPSNVIPWYNFRDRFGVKTRQINLDSGTDLLSEVKTKFGPRTRMVSVSHVSRNNGRIIRTDQSAELADYLHQRNVRYHLDGAQGPGCVPVDFHALGCDYYSTCGHKWLLGPRGTGALFVRREILDETLLSWNGAHSHATMDYEGHYELKPDASRFEFGTRALADFAGFDRALTWMETVGLERIYQRIQDLVEFAIERTQKSPELEIASPTTREDRSGIFVLRLPEGVDANEVYQKLSSEKRILTSPVRRERDLRIAIHFFNTEDEIEQAFQAIEAYLVSN